MVCGDQMKHSSLLRDVPWRSDTCALGWAMMGLWPAVPQDVPDIASVAVTDCGDRALCAVPSSPSSLCAATSFPILPDVPCVALMCCAVLCCAVLCCAVLCCAVLCCAVLCCAVLCCGEGFSEEAHGRRGEQRQDPPPELPGAQA
jgi:hypothetical protein